MTLFEEDGLEYKEKYPRVHTDSKKKKKVVQQTVFRRKFKKIIKLPATWSPLKCLIKIRLGYSGKIYTCTHTPSGIHKKIQRNRVRNCKSGSITLFRRFPLHRPLDRQRGPSHSEGSSFQAEDPTRAEAQDQDRQAWGFTLAGSRRWWQKGIIRDVSGQVESYNQGDDLYSIL